MSDSLTIESTVADVVEDGNNTFPNCYGAKVKMEELFMRWLCLDSTREMVISYIQDAREGKFISPDASQPPPRSPTSKKQQIHRSFTTSTSSPTASEISADYKLSTNSTQSNQNSMKNLIPTFYIPNSKSRRAVASDQYSSRKNDILKAFEEFPNGVLVDDFVSITKDLCRFPSFFNAPLFRRIISMYGRSEDKLKLKQKTVLMEMSPDANIDLEQLRITLDVFETFWIDEIEPYDIVERFHRLIKQPNSNYITQSDLMPMLHELLTYHPGLEFLSGTPEFQEKYALTVIVRIFYSVDRDHSGRISLRDLRRSNLVDLLIFVDEEEDINKVNCYFSYEHFYVLYCKFWELDGDHDFVLSREDLMRYGGHSLTRAIVDRIFECGRRPFGRMQSLTSSEKLKMSYEDFVYFMLSEEDKGNPVSLRYWFELIDFNEDGVIRIDEMRYFYQQQVHRMECLGHEVVPFEDVLCQLSDLLSPEIEGEFVFSNFTNPEKIRVSGVFFNVLFNLSKFIAFEQRDPFLLRQQMAEPDLTDWDRYARSEYARLAMEEEGRDDEGMEMDDGVDGWYISEDEDDMVHSPVTSNDSSAFANTGIRGTAEAPF